MLHPKVFPLLAVLSSALLSSCSGGGGGGSAQGSSQGLSISGTILAASHSQVDNDVNDPNANNTSNTSADLAQDISAPGTVGGYLNATNDPEDNYRVTMQTGDRITLSMSAPLQTSILNNGNILRLELHQSIGSTDSSTLITFASSRARRIDQLIVGSNGEKIIKVKVLSGASNYTLQITRNSQAKSLIMPAEPFAAGEILARFRPQLTGVQNNLQEQLSAMKMQAKHLFGDTYRLRMQDLPDQVSGVLQTQSKQDRRQQTWDRIQQLRQRPDVVYAEPNYQRHALRAFTPNDPFAKQQWHLSVMNLPDAWGQLQGQNMTPAIIAVIDSGIVADHPDLSQQLIPSNRFNTGYIGYDFISSNHDPLDGDGPDDDPNDPGQPSLGGRIFHGSQVAGAAAAQTNNAIGVAGAAGNFGIRIMPLRALGGSGGFTDDICEAVRFAVKLDNRSGLLPDQAAQVLNLSFGGSQFSQTEQDCMNAARNTGAIIIAAAGNENSAQPSYPAAYDGVVAVSATDAGNQRTSYTNFGPWIDIAAPGGEMGADLNGDGHPDGILGPLIDDSFGTAERTYGFASGTSLSAPLVSGVVAMMKSLAPILSPAVFDQWLLRGFLTDDLGAFGRDDDYGYGLINANKAVVQTLNAATNANINLPPVLLVSPAQLQMGVALNEASLTVNNAGGGALDIPVTSISYTRGNGWLNLIPPANTNGLGVYRVRVDVAGLSTGIYQASISFTASGQTSLIPVQLEVAQIDQRASAGYQYVLLVNAQTQETITQQGISPQQGTYPFRFDNVAPGNYLIFAGSDMDNDSQICDAGESCGAYADMSSPITLSIRDRSRDKLRFVVNFNTTSSLASVIGQQPLVLHKKTP